MRHLTLFALLIPTTALAQGTAADYQRAAELPKLTANKVFRSRVEPHWFANGDRFWYRNDLADGKKEFVVIDATKGTREVGTEAPKADEIKVELPRPKDDPRPRAVSPDGRYEVRSRTGNLLVRDRKSGEEFTLTRDGKEGDGFDGGVWWSPDSSRFVAMRTKDAPTRQVNFVESSPRDQLQPRLQAMSYAKPGDVLAVRKPHLFDVAKREEIAIADTLFPNPWSIDRLKWDADSARFTFLYNQRGHQVMRLIAVDAGGKATAVINEECKTFFDYAGKLYLRRLEKSDDLIWMSERDGWNHLYRIDAKTGAVKNAITRGEWVVRSVVYIDEAKQQVWFGAGGVRPGQDPYHLHFCRANLDGTGLVVLTEGDGTHEMKPSPDGRFSIDTYSRVDLPPVTELRRMDDGKLICELEKADASKLLATGWKLPERFTAKGRDGVTDIYGMIFRPTNFDPAKKYPVIEEIYAGPHDSHVPKAFRPFYFNAQTIAELGFVVVKIDGMGTSNRSKAFHDVCWKNLADAGFPDRIAWIKAAAQKHPEMDLSRVGIYGGSAGGQNAMRALLSHGDFYRAAVADCGCHDNRMDKVWWNELWMSYPVGPHYEASSNVADAHKLRGKLLLIVGEVDRNVDPASTMQVANALIKADKDFDLLVMTGVGHGSAETPYGQRRRKDFFVRHLLGVEPRRE